MMARTWLQKSSLVAVGVLTVGAVLAGCGPGTPEFPVTFYADSVTAYWEEDMVVFLENPAMNKLFIPAAWTGLAVYRKMIPESWSEYLYPDGFEPMITTTEDRIQYSIPGGTLEPGNYKLILQGRIGRDGTPFALEVDLVVIQSTATEACDTKDLGGN